MTEELSHDSGLIQTARLCAFCHKELSDGALFCAGCGHSSAELLHAVSEPREKTQAVNRYEGNWSELQQVGWLFGLLLLSSLLLGFFSRVSKGPWAETIASGIDAYIVMTFVATRWADILPLLRLPSVTTRRSFELVGTALSFLSAMGAYFALLERVGVPMISMTKPFLAAGWPIWSMFGLISVLPAIVEEIAFRGFIQSALGRVLGDYQAWIAQAALFSVSHLLVISFPSHFIMGLCLGYMRLRSKSLYPGIALHATWNALVLLQELYF